MKRLTSPAAVLIVVVALVAMLMSFARGISDTAREFAPIPQATAQIAVDRREQEAQVTATYIAVLSSEIVSDTQNTHAIARAQTRSRYQRSKAVESAVALGKRVVIAGAAFAAALSSFGFGVWAAAKGTAAGISKVKQTRVIVLPDRAVVYQLPSGELRLIEPRAGGRNVDASADSAGCQLAARDVREFQGIVARAFFEAVGEALRPSRLLPPG